MIRLVIGVLFALAGFTGLGEADDSMRIAVTTSFQNSGLSAPLLKAFESDTGLTVHLLVVGTGQALRLGRAGDVDAILVHSRAAEEMFVADGFATHRRDIMYNDFVLVGPDIDPARVANATSALDALKRIASNHMLFASRGDDSGTHRKELSLWKSAGVAVSSRSTWYRATGSGMGATLNTASGLNAYILTDRASWLNFANKGELALLFAGDPLLFNQYGYLPINPERHPHVNYEAATRLENWLTSKRGQALIAEHRIDGETLFFPNARAQ